ncbi:DUF1376 domain-containing protein [Gemmata sp. G18]|uniref:DUF1376 domain-containing protein n=1 Tax=Gemmata palustris TaxID=2822762 RepID=A0ABS5BNV6_9BACT|nr:DUF1376 domain-containing protein [Gemmata palustris]MBP3955417.1 DUF1376 domain-containing protein [Gemmata palustris]
MTSKSPAFQFYAKDWLSSSKIALMPPEYEGAYIRLLAYCWDSGDCSLPDDDTVLSRLSRLGEGWLNGGSSVVRHCFMPHPAKPGFLTNHRLLEEAEKQAAWQRKSAEGGRKSAAKRAEKRAISNGGSTKCQPAAPPPVQPNVNSSSASSSSTAVIEEDDESRAKLTAFQRVYEYGCSLFPQLATQNTSVIHQWITSGASVDLDILPEIKRLHEKQVQPRGWGLFTQDVANAKSRREAPLPKGEIRHAKPRTNHGGFAEQDYRAGTAGFEVT